MRRAGAVTSSSRGSAASVLRRMTAAVPSAPRSPVRAPTPTPTTSAAAVTAASSSSSGAADPPPRPQPPTILLLDVMDTLVSDPFYEAMPRHFGLPFKELLAAKHPTAWLEFEKGDISEEAMLSKFFKDGRPVDGPALTGMMGAHYRLLDGVEPLLDRLKQARVEMHACSNYPVWWRNVEKSVALSRWLAWTFVSCEGPMMGHRKPSPEAYATVCRHLAVAPDRCIFVDDRAANVEAAAAFGMRAVRFEGCAAKLERELREQGLEF